MEEISEKEWSTNADGILNDLIDKIFYKNSIKVLKNDHRFRNRHDYFYKRTLKTFFK